MVSSLEGDLAFREPIDIIFCSNLAHQVGALRRSRALAGFYRHLGPGGYLFVNGPTLLAHVPTPLRLVAPTVYKKCET
jgi:chemotaxis protein methyltransferase CheR